MSEHEHEHEHVDIVIIGAGMVGLLLAVALAQEKFNIAIIEAKNLAIQWDDKPTARVSAVNVASMNILKNLNILHDISENDISSLERLMVWDDQGGGEIEFDSAELGVKTLGSIISNRAMVKALYNKLNQFNHVQFILNDAPISFKKNEKEVQLLLKEGRIICAPLCIGADGAHSWVRAQMATKIKTRSYQQHAIIAVVTIQLEHQHTGWQVFLPTGPLALLPLVNKNQCAIVWSVSHTRHDELMQMDDVEFEKRLNNAFGLRLGKIKYLCNKQSFPLVMQHVAEYVEPRTALVGDAAHTIHPLAGQGVNLGFLDAAVLTSYLVDARKKNQDIGSYRPLRRYARSRRGDNTEMICAMRAFNDVFMSDSLATITLRSQGLNLTNNFLWLKKQFVNIALGNKSNVPTLAKG